MCETCQANMADVGAYSNPFLTYWRWTLIPDEHSCFEILVSAVSVTQLSTCILGCAIPFLILFLFFVTTKSYYLHFWKFGWSEEVFNQSVYQTVNDVTFSNSLHCTANKNVLYCTWCIFDKDRVLFIWLLVSHIYKD